MSDIAIVAAFVEQYRTDKQAGRVRPVAEYQARFPGFEALIAREYADLREAEIRGNSVAEGDRWIGSFKILNELGRGGQGEVYLAEDSRLNRKVALKVLRGLDAYSDEVLSRFRREAEITSRLEDPGICPVYESGVANGVAYIAMRYVEGETLGRRIASTKDRLSSKTGGTIEGSKPGRLESPSGEGHRKVEPPDLDAILDAVQIIEKTARVLHAAHEAGIIHRDVKPSNIVVTPSGNPVVLDFGLARDETGALMSLTSSGECFGTPAYMSPEQLVAHRIRLDRRTDVWSLGVMLYECVALQRPFEAPTREGLYEAIRVKDPADPRQVSPSMPNDLRIVIATALEKDRDRRYQTALDLAEELRRVRMHEPIVAMPVGPLVRLKRWAQRNPAVAAAVGGLFAVLAIGFTVAIILLGKVTTERNDKQAALADFNRLGDLSRLEALRAEAEKLWPCAPALAPAMRSWVARASSLRDRLGGHEAVLARFGSEWQSDDPAEQFKHDTTAKLVADLTAFVDPDPKKGLLAHVSSRLSFAESVERESLVKYEADWKRATESIAASPKYHRFNLKPQLGLIPIDTDPKSDLWEFVHLQTAAPGTNPVPKRAPDGRLIVTEDTGLVFVLMPAGAFRMGAIRKPANADTPMTSPDVDPLANGDEGPVTEVPLEPFFLSKYEMTQGQWLRLVGKNPSHYASGDEWGRKIIELRNPVEQVSRDDCDFWLDRLGLVLPTEAQWEYGARGGTTTPWWTGSGTDVLATAENLSDDFCRKNGGHRSWECESWNDGYTYHAPIGSFSSNGFGLHDVLGNVEEWCRDSYSKYELKPRAADGLRPPSGLRGRVARGGSWHSVASGARVTGRSPYMPDLRVYILGVRPARNVTP